MNDDRAIGAALRALPDPEPPAAVWERVAASASPRRRVRQWAPFAVAAAVAVAVVAGIVYEPAPTQPDPRFARLMAESKGLERLLAEQPAVPSGTRSVLVHRLASLDGELSEALVADAEPERTLELLRQRVALLRALADVDSRAAAAWQRNIRPAVYRGE